MPELAIWSIFFLPIISFLVISFLLRPFLNDKPRLSGYLAVLSIAGSLLLSFWVLSEVINAPGHRLSLPDHEWAMVGNLTIRVGLIVDSLTAVMLIVVTLVSLMVQIYSQGYMHGDPGYHRYFAFMSLFTGSMLGLVMADNLIMLYVFWEMVGLCSYLLIGFWYHRPAAAAAAKKAFIVTRFGDLGFLLAILFVVFQTDPPTFDIERLHSLAVAGTLGGTAITLLALGVFAGAMGKSAQFPLHTWLPDAMEGPTPVSALIHAATMVAAGVFLVARMFPVFEASPQAMTTVSVIGGVTAVFAATMGLVVYDMKRVMAYSTISQLGYMMLGLGVGAYAAGIFHLFNHAFFKALLFLGAGSANHTTGTFDMRFMGGLRRYMPWTFATLTVASLSLAGIPPFSGFWSKDEILLETLHKNQALFWLALVGVFMTAFYVFRMMFMAFGGKYRGGASAEHVTQHSAHSHALHESPPVMVVPMLVLGVLSVISGVVNLPWSFGLPPHWLADFLGGEAAGFDVNLAGTSSLVAALGIFLAYAIYSARWLSAERVGKLFGPIYTLVYRKYYFDELYEDLIVTRGLYRNLSFALDWFDRNIIDNVVDGMAWLGRNVGRPVSRVQTGQVQVYGIGISLGILLILAAFIIFGR
ncbi:MAG: NADH-quinone oxidoreductase subunit L [Chloroflexi bacterium]|nr:NADH-quinone oxidoreductase subunit L [Chloroflexota bacterium]